MRETRKLNGKKRPIFLTLYQMRFPVTAIVSILHRVTGVVLFLALPLYLFWLYVFLMRPEYWAHCTMLNGRGLFLWAWPSLSALAFHFIAGLRHLCMDMHLLSHKLTTGKWTSYMVLLGSIAVSAWIGERLW